MKSVRANGSGHQGTGSTAGYEHLPAELLDAENSLIQLADVFFQTGIEFDDRAPQPDSELPTITNFYRTLVEQIPAVVFIAFLDNRFGEAYVSPQIEEALGYTQEEWLNDPVRWYRQIHPDDKERWSGEVAKLFLTGDPLISVYRVLSRTGEVVWFRCEVRMVRRDDGHPWFLHGVGFDITDLKNAEEALGVSERMLGGIFEHAPDTMIVADGSGRIDRVNAQVSKMFGYDPDELVGKPVEVLIPERYHDRHPSHRDNFAAERHLRPMGMGLRLYGRKKNGDEFPVEVMLSPVTTDSGDLVIAVIRDVTRREKSEQALREYAERMKVLSQNLLDVQEAERRRIALELHDQIGQILTGLKLKLEMLARTPGKKAGQMIEEAHELVNELIHRTRELSLDLRPATLDHLGLLSALRRHLRHYTSQTSIKVDLDHEGLEGRRFQPELETAAFRIVQEGLTNIARHSGSRDAAIRIYVTPKKLTIEIEDHGAGFDPTNVFAVGQSSGLTGMRERAMLLGGSFSVESEPGRTALTAEWELPNLSD